MLPCGLVDDDVLPDDLDGCDLDFADDSATEEEQELLPLFPQGHETEDLDAKTACWNAQATGGA